MISRLTRDCTREVAHPPHTPLSTRHQCLCWTAHHAGRIGLRCPVLPKTIKEFIVFEASCVLSRLEAGSW